MATTIRSTGLDFQAIKNNLKTFLQQDEFADYNFEASGLSNILDVLAYNTHYNGLIANFALNESYISTAQLRQSLVGLANSIGYIVDSKQSSYFIADISITDVDGPLLYTLPSGYKFTTTVDDGTYTFQTLQSYTAEKSPSGVYTWENVTIYEGTKKTKSFIATSEADEDIYIIPDESLDINSVTVRVYSSASQSSDDFTTYTKLSDISSLDENTTAYVLREAPNGFFELTFGNGSAIGNRPIAGNRVVVEYLSVSGSKANGGRIFTESGDLSPLETSETFPISFVSVTAQSLGGSDKEKIESIRKNAPFLYAAQNRMVTAADYTSLITKKFDSVIDKIQCWGGEDNPDPDFGKVYASIVFKFEDQANADELTRLEQNKIRQLVDELGISSFDIVFTEPERIYIEVDCSFQYNPKQTVLTLPGLQGVVKKAISDYFATETGDFGESFRKSNLLTDIDESNSAVLSSRADIKMQYRLEISQVSTNELGETATVSRFNTPTDYLISFPQELKETNSEAPVVISGSFIYNNRTARIQNKLGEYTLQVVYVDDLSVAVDNVGDYNTNGIVNLVGFEPQNYSTGSNYIRITAKPGNESTITPSRNLILEYDQQTSSVLGIKVSE